jgi:hypothetical protein
LLVEVEVAVVALVAALVVLMLEEDLVLMDHLHQLVLMVSLGLVGAVEVLVVLQV